MRAVWAVSWSFLVAGCGSLGPLPEEYAADLPPSVTLDEEQKQSVVQLTQQAWGHLQARRYDEARDAAEAALELDPRAARARAVRARCLMEEALVESPPELRSWRRAEGDLRIAERLQPDDPEIGLLHAEFLEADGHVSAAAAVVDRILRANPNDVRSLSLAGRLHYELGQERSAARYLEALVERDPRDVEALYRLAQCRLRLAVTGLRELEHDDEKIELFERAIESFSAYRALEPGDAEGLSGEAFARFRVLVLRGGEPDPAEISAIERMYKSAGALGDLSPEHEFNRGVVLEYAGDSDGARLAYEKVLQQDPEHLPSLLNLAASLLADGKNEAAVPYCERALLLGPTPNERRKLVKFLGR